MTKTRTVVAVAAVVVLAAVVIVIVGGRFPWSDGSASTCDIPERVAGRPAPASSAPGGGGIRVVEQGFTHDPATGAVQVGVLLENTGKSVAYQTTVRFRLFDAAHAELPEVGAPLAVEIPIILPGQRIGAGTGSYHRDERVASVEIVPDSTSWLSRDATGSFSPVTARYVRAARFNPRIPSSVDIHYREKSANCRPLTSRTTAVVFRDSGGKIVGGGAGTPDTPIIFRDEQGKDLGGERRRPPTPSCSPGERETWIVPPTGAPTITDDTRTEIYPYCDLA
jgi:hypothetical protein